jgi:hypothetical protein
MDPGRTEDPVLAGKVSGRHGVRCIRCDRNHARDARLAGSAHNLFDLTLELSVRQVKVRIE